MAIGYFLNESSYLKSSKSSHYVVILFSNELKAFLSIKYTERVNVLSTERRFLRFLHRLQWSHTNKQEIQQHVVRNCSLAIFCTYKHLLSQTPQRDSHWTKVLLDLSQCTLPWAKAEHLAKKNDVVIRVRRNYGFLSKLIQAEKCEAGGELRFGAVLKLSNQWPK